MVQLCIVKSHTYLDIPTRDLKQRRLLRQRQQLEVKFISGRRLAFRREAVLSPPNIYHFFLIWFLKASKQTRQYTTGI